MVKIKWNRVSASVSPAPPNHHIKRAHKEPFLKIFKINCPISSNLPQCWLIGQRYQSSARPGMEIVNIADSSLIFKIRPSPCAIHYDNRWATMPSADFCSITPEITSRRTIGFHQIRSLRLMKTKSQGACIPDPHWFYTDCPKSRSSRTLFSTPLRGVRALTFPASQEHFVTSFGRAGASFTVAGRSHGFVVLHLRHKCQLTFSLRLIGCFCSSARSFAPGFIQTRPRGLALAFR